MDGIILVVELPKPVERPKMTQNDPLSKQTLVRLPKIKAGLIQKQTHEQIGESCHVSDKTIDRDIRDWVKTNDFYVWLHELWLDLYKQLPDPEVPFKEVTKLIGKGMIQKTEAYSYEKIEETVTFNVSEDEDSILNQAANILDKRLSDKKKLAEIHH